MANNTQRPTGRQSKWGICTNPNCPNYRQKIEIERGDLVCPEESCKKPLSPCAPPSTKKSGGGSKSKLPIIIGAAVILIAGVIVAITMFGGHEPTLLTLNKTQCELTVGECDTIVARITPIDDVSEVMFQSSNEDVAMVSSTGIVRAIAEGEATITVEVKPKKGEAIMQDVVVKVSPQMDCNTGDSANIAEKESVEDSLDNVQPTVKKTNAKATSNTGVLSLSYGRYSGSIRNGYPHGQGRLTYTTSRVINRNDPKGRTANPGDYVIGEFFNGFVVYGKHYNSAGELLESLNIGVGSESSYDSK